MTYSALIGAVPDVDLLSTSAIPVRLFVLFLNSKSFKSNQHRHRKSKVYARDHRV